MPTLVDVPNPPQKLASKRPAPTCRTPPVCKQPRPPTTQKETIDELGNTIIVILLIHYNIVHMIVINIVIPFYVR